MGKSLEKNVLWRYRRFYNKSKILISWKAINSAKKNENENKTHRVINFNVNDYRILFLIIFYYI